MGMEKKRNYKYTTLNNLCYIFSGAVKWRPLILICTIALAITEGLKDFIWIYGGKHIIEILENSEDGMDNFQRILWIVLIASILEGLFVLVMQVSETTASSRITDIRCNFILMANRKIMKMPFELFENPKVADLKRKCDYSTATMTEGMEGVVRESAHLFSRLIMMITAAVILFYLSPLLVLIMCLLTLLRGVVQDKMARYEKEEFHDKMIPKWREEYYYYRKASDFEYAKDIRIYNMKGAIGEKQQKIWEYLIEHTEKLHNKWRNTLLSQTGVGLIQEGIMYIYLIYAVLNQGMSIANFMLYVGSIRSFNNAMMQLLERWLHMVRDSRMICDFRDFLEYPEISEEVVGKSSFKKDYKVFMGEGKKEYFPIPIPKDRKYQFRFENVSFAYPGSETYALKGLNLTLEAGERLAVVGLNGAGKSTFIMLLCRLYEPTKGTIYMNGQDISKYNKEEYYELISPVFQNVECFAFPLAENVSMLVPEETDKERVMTCVNNAGLGDKVKKLENGIDTELLKFLKMDGVELSGGEKQKMALARALYKDAPIVVLDEPTAALDALAEYQTYMDFDRLIGGKTAVYISHRLSSTRFCHHIAMFENGTMIEYGTHEELLNAGKAYAEMFDVQAQYYKEEGENVYA